MKRRIRISLMIVLSVFFALCALSLVAFSNNKVVASANAEVVMEKGASILADDQNGRYGIQFTAKIPQSVVSGYDAEKLEVYSTVNFFSGDDSLQKSVKITKIDFTVETGEIQSPLFT